MDEANPTILATLAVVAAILPMAFVGGLMGPYMRPIPIGASAAMLFSLIVAFLVTPWAAVRILKPGGGHHDGEREDVVTRISPGHGGLLHRPSLRWSFLSGVLILLLGSVSLFYVGFVKVKMLPFDNKSEFQVIIDMPNGTTLEETARVTRLLAEETQKQQEVNVETYVGTASPYNFNGLVRHYYLRRGPNVADIQVNILPKGERNLQSHEIASACECGSNLSRNDTRRASRSPRCRPARRCCRPWLQKCTGRASRAGSRSRGAFVICLSRRTELSMSTGTWRMTSPSTGWSSIKRRQR